jgi:hypothetical protein
MHDRLRKKSLSIPNAKSSTRLDALYAIAEPSGYISLPPDFAISRARKTFSAACGAYDGETEVILDLLGLVYDAAGDASLEGLLVRWV